MGPTQLGTQCVQNLGVRKNFCNTHAVAKLAFAPSLAKIGHELPRQFGHHLLAVFALLPLQQLGADAPPDVPVKLGELGIDRTSYPLAGSIDQLAQFGQQGARDGNGLSHAVDGTWVTFAGAQWRFSPFRLAFSARCADGLHWEWTPPASGLSLIEAMNTSRPDSLQTPCGLVLRELDSLCSKRLQQIGKIIVLSKVH